MEHGLVLLNAALAAAALVYVYRRERSEASLHWAGSWVALCITGALASLPDPPLAARVAAHALGVGLCLLLLTGALAHASLHRPRWLVPLGLATLASSAVVPLLVSPRSAYWAAPFFEAPMILAAAAIVWRKSPRLLVTDRLLAFALTGFALLDFVDGGIRATGNPSLALILVWQSLFIVVALLQLATLLERSLQRERQLGEDLTQSRRLEVLGRLAADLGHTLGNRLTVVIGNAALLRDGLDRDEAMRESLGELEQAAFECADRARELQIFARECRSEPRPVELAPLVQEVAGAFRSSHRDGPELCVELAPELPRALADPNQLRRVLVQLLEHACESAGSSGWVRLRLEPRATRPSSVPPSVEPRRQWISLEVSDNGEVLAAERQEHAFDPFVSSKADPEGGLGLSLVYGVVRAHGGSIEVESRPEGGSVLRVAWPAASTAAARHGHHRRGRRPPRAERRLARAARKGRV